VGGLTYNGHPISLAAAKANIEVIQSENLVEHTRAMQPIIEKYMEELKGKHACVGDVRAIGLFGAIELIKDKNSKLPLGEYGKTSTILKDLKDFTLSKGLFHYTHDNLILIIPPLIISAEELALGFSVLDEALTIADTAL
jgi:taurine--2-oxoglutarate transaminase